MKLFVWDTVLISWSSGVAFALADTVHEARQLIVGYEEKASEVERYNDWLSRGAPSDDAEQLWTDLQAEPAVYEQPFGMYLWGGD